MTPNKWLYFCGVVLATTLGAPSAQAFDCSEISGKLNRADRKILFTADCRDDQTGISSCLAFHQITDKINDRWMHIITLYEADNEEGYATFSFLGPYNSTFGLYATQIWDGWQLGLYDPSLNARYDHMGWPTNQSTLQTFHLNRRTGKMHYQAKAGGRLTDDRRFTCQMPEEL
jgi:hypothetical protein